MFREIREYENFHIVLWLLKDTCWAVGWETGGMIMIVPTFLAGIYIAYRSRKILADFFHNIAVCLWITANGIWMFGEFYFNDDLRNYAMVFFALGLIVVAVYYIFLFPKKHSTRLNEVEYPKSK
jgi:hypothetical protein